VSSEPGAGPSDRGRLAFLQKAIKKHAKGATTRGEDAIVVSNLLCNVGRAAIRETHINSNVRDALDFYKCEMSTGFGRNRLVHLDMLRGLAAVGVVAGHARGFVLVQYAAAPSDTFAVQLFYFFTGLGHQCVIAFFALSGYLVGGQALRNIVDGQFYWPRYMLRRLSRLWTVLVPALFLTLALDVPGQILAGPAGYEGAFYDLLASGPHINAPADLSISTFVANIFFLQTIAAPVFGSNGPLWSLANEFWYYIIFPFMAAALIGPRPRAGRVIIGCIGLAVAFVIPREMLYLGSIWVAGALGQYIARRFAHHLATRLLRWTALAFIMLVAFLFVDKLRPGLASDLLLGAAFAGSLPVLALLPSLGKVYEGVAGALANISYTLYATHFPLLAFIWFVALAPSKWPLGLRAIILMIALGTATLIVAVVMWWFFERNTDRLRRVLEFWLSIDRRTNPKQWRNIW
jgi:peptidoglycan/LPS O-acetylase OafA/YrhL